MPQPIDLIFTRDFALFMSDLWHALLNGVVAKEFGKGLPSQIARFTGRSTEFYRIRTELAAMKERVIGKTLNHVLFSEKRTARFRKDVDALRALFKKPIGEDRFARWKSVMEFFTAMYPMYMLSIFLPNPWRDDFVKRHGKAAEAILERLYQNRVYSEGLFKETDLYCRTLLTPILERHGVKKSAARLLRLRETERCLREEKAPSQEELAQRGKGYVLFRDTLFVKNFAAFLEENNLIYEFPLQENEGTIKGNVACAGGVVTGTVQVILSTDEVSRFEKGNILITSMTSPEYLQAMKGSKAIITDEGGITCHAAITSRELGIPCVIGVKIATKIFKDGDRVEVDATNGVVRKI